MLVPFAVSQKCLTAPSVNLCTVINRNQSTANAKIMPTAAVALFSARVEASRTGLKYITREVRTGNVFI